MIRNRNVIKNIFLFISFSVFISCANHDDKVGEFRLKTLDGRIITDQTLKGKITVVNIWATWCGTCLAEIPELNELANKYKQDTTVLFLALSDESGEKVRSLLERKQFNFVQVPNAYSLTSMLRTGFRNIYPKYFVIGKDLNVKYQHTDKLEDLVPVLSNEIEKAR